MSYALCFQFEADISSTPLDAEVKLPVIIGTVPLQQSLYADPSAVVVDQPSGGLSGMTVFVFSDSQIV